MSQDNDNAITPNNIELTAMNDNDLSPTLSDSHSQNRKEEDEVTTSATTEDAGDGAMSTVENRVIVIHGPQVQRFCGNDISTGKYSIFSFIPSFLFEQFRRYSNCFFLFIALLQQIPNVSPTGRYTTLVPLLFILSVSALKEILEDFKRHRADRETNDRQVEVLRNGHWLNIKWKEVVVGDIVKIQNNNFFPADLVLLASSEPQGICFIETANLDGETNLKIRQGLGTTIKLINKKELKHFKGTVSCEPPNRMLYEFIGVLKEQNKETVPLGPDQILLRGAMLRNTAWVFALVIYTGADTKLIRNSTRAPLKRSNVDRLTNTQVIMLFAILLILAFISAGMNEFWTKSHNNKDWYIGISEMDVKNFGYNLLTFIILYNNLVPISLQVTIEMVRFIQAIFINMDLKMYHEETDTPAVARTSNLNEELGQVKYIFSDKTGTLTRNIMEFKKCCIGTKIYSIDEPGAIYQDVKGWVGQTALIQEFLALLAVCHTVIPERSTDGKIIYHAASPDERALVMGAEKFGYVFETRTPSTVTINAHGTKMVYQILSVLEFTSTRKRMSVVVRDPNGKIKLYCKGADNVIYERLGSVGQQTANELLQNLEIFATEGLRTLCLAVTEVSETFFKEWKTIYDSATTALQNRESKISQAADMIEKNLLLLGATAIEDKLQDQVPETIATLLEANIHIWVLTGDKQETAINIGYASRLIVHGMCIIIMNEDSLDSTREGMQRHSNDLGDRLGQENNIALVIDGKTLKYALSCELRREFLDLCISCKVVICCRVSPIQKAEVVELVSQHTKSITLAIGDGANDVAMIQKANVGVGISGVEGLQAACASDYSIAQFKFLLRLLLVHGAWNYSRMCKLILYSFYKNICLYVIELWFAIYSAWSGQIIFEQWCIGFFNLFFTALPPFAMGMFDKPCSDDLMVRFPKLYLPSQDARLFNVKVFWVWMINGLFHSIALYWLPMVLVVNDVLWKNGLSGGYLVLGNTIYTYVVITVCLKAGLVINTWTWPTHVSIWGSILLWFSFLWAYSNVWPTLPVGAEMLGQHKMVFTSPAFWFGLFLIPLITLLPDIAFKVIRTIVNKSEMDLIRESEVLGTNYHREPKPSLTETARLLKNVKSVFMRRSTTRMNLEMELSHGYAFSQEEGATVTQTDVIRAYDTNIPKPEGM